MMFNDDECVYHIQTFTGKMFSFVDMDPDTICIEDISHSLSMINRFTGHTKVPYSVAAHSVNMAMIAPKEYKLDCLLHDAAEAYTNDISSPLKRLLPDYKKIQNRLERVISHKFGTMNPMPQYVHDLDRHIVTNEAQLLLEGGPLGEWPSPLDFDPAIQVMSAEDSEAAFLEMFYCY